jgi:hypothetical protein
VYLSDFINFYLADVFVRFRLPSYTVVEDEAMSSIEVVLSNQPALDIEVQIFASK